MGDPRLAPQPEELLSLLLLLLLLLLLVLPSHPSRLIKAATCICPTRAASSAALSGCHKHAGISPASAA
jgi:hypothetical protein